MIEFITTKKLQEILPVVRELSAYEKLVLAQILVQDSLQDPLILLLQPHTEIELYSPIEVSGNLERFESLLQPT